MYHGKRISIFIPYPHSALEKEMAAHSSTLAWKIQWMEERGRLPFMGSQRVIHDRATSLPFFLILCLQHWCSFLTSYHLNAVMPHFWLDQNPVLALIARWTVSIGDCCGKLINFCLVSSSFPARVKGSPILWGWFSSLYELVMHSHPLLIRYLDTVRTVLPGVCFENKVLVILYKWILVGEKVATCVRTRNFNWKTI